MNKYLEKVYKVFRKIYFFFPTPLPRGMAEFESWAKDIIDTYSLPDNDSVRFAFATQILHSDSSQAFKPKRYFVLQTLKGMSNQIACGVMQDLKEKQAAQAAAEKAAIEAKAVTNESAG
jgi:hypothetical protein